jgi:hypothetical protein
MGALGGHRRFCGQLSTAVARAPVLCEDLTLSAEDGGAEAVVLPARAASTLPAELHLSLLCSYDFATYFYNAIVPGATMLEVRASVLEREEGESGLPPPPPPAEMALFDPVKHVRGADAAKAAKAKKKKGVTEEDLSSDVRQMLRVVQLSSWSDWEAMFSAAPGDEPSEMVHALHLLSVHLLLVDLLEPNRITAGADFCALLGEASRRLLNGATLCPYTWPELLRMVLLARSVAQAPKKRAVALNAMMSSGHGSASVAFAASAALGGGHRGRCVAALGGALGCLGGLARGGGLRGRACAIRRTVGTALGRHVGRLAAGAEPACARIGDQPVELGERFHRELRTQITCRPQCPNSELNVQTLLLSHNLAHARAGERRALCIRHCRNT